MLGGRGYTIGWSVVDVEMQWGRHDGGWHLAFCGQRHGRRQVQQHPHRHHHAEANMQLVGPEVGRVC